ncbi:MAG: hypothetical protein GZ089_01485, partial [Aromatoleum sp.]|nr:hypothetical protein [Aromatoleum sp.]
AAVPKVAGIAANLWTAAGPFASFAGRLQAFHVDRANPKRLLAGAATGGLWNSEDQGLSWAPVDDYLPSLAIAAIAADAVDPAILYAATSEYHYTATKGVGVLKSTNGGVTWQRLPATDPSVATQFAYIMALAAHPAAAGVLIAGTWSGVYRSVDGGANWSRVFNPPMFDGKSTPVFDVRFSPTDPNRVVASLDDGAIAYSADAGATFVQVQIVPALSQRGTAQSKIAFAPTVPGTLFASVARNGGELWGSWDYGQSWLQISAQATGAALAQNALWVDPTNANRIVVGGVDLVRSVDGGQTYVKISDWTKWPTSAHADQHAIVEDPRYDGASNASVYFASDAGVYRADVTTVTPTVGWANLNSGLNATQFKNGAASTAAGGIFVGGTQDNGTLVLQRGTDNWYKWFGGDGGTTWIDPTNAQVFYGEYVYAAVQRTTDGGATRNLEYICTGITEALKPGPGESESCGPGTTGEANFYAPTVLDPNQPGRLYVGAKSLWVTDDARASPPFWRTVKTASAVDKNYISAIAVQPGDANNVWVGHNNGEVYATANALAITPTWRVVTGLPARYVARIVFDRTNRARIYIAFGGFTANNLWLTGNGGATWAAIGSALPAAPIYALAVGLTDGQLLYAGTEVGVFASADGGTTWSASNEGPANVPVEDLVVLDDGTIAAATYGRGLYYSGGTPTGTAVEYYWARRDHYFISADPVEIAALDHSPPGGWVRTGYTFRTYAAPGAGASPVCRFYIPPAYGDSHYFSASPDECAAVRAKFPMFVYEAPNVFYIGLPSTVTGACPPGLIPVYRLWDNRADTNHRYTSSKTVRSAMLAKGYVAEGYGPEIVSMCAPP